MAYIIVLQTSEDEQLQIFASDDLKMMSVLKKAIQSEHDIISVTAVENIIIANDFLDVNEDLNFGSK
jgi:hypothetical protein